MYLVTIYIRYIDIFVWSVRFHPLSKFSSALYLYMKQRELGLLMSLRFQQLAARISNRWLSTLPRTMCSLKPRRCCSPDESYQITIRQSRPYAYQWWPYLQLWAAPNRCYKSRMPFHLLCNLATAPLTSSREGGLSLSLRSVTQAGSFQLPPSDLRLPTCCSQDNLSTRTLDYLSERKGHWWAPGGGSLSQARWHHYKHLPAPQRDDADHQASLKKPTEGTGGNVKKKTKKVLCLSMSDTKQPCVLRITLTWEGEQKRSIFRAW